MHQMLLRHGRNGNSAAEGSLLLLACLEIEEFDKNFLANFPYRY
jgi:hypothetical protein